MNPRATTRVEFTREELDYLRHELRTGQARRHLVVGYVGAAVVRKLAQASDRLDLCERGTDTVPV